MAVNEALNAYSGTASSNTPAGSDAVGTDLDDHLRDIKKNIHGASRWVQTATASAAATLPATMLHKVQPVDPNTTGASVTITLPSAATVGDGWCTAIRNTTGAKLVIIDGSGSETVDGAADITLSATAQGVMLGSDGSNFVRLADSNAVNPLSFDDYSAMSASSTAIAATDRILLADASDSDEVKTVQAAKLLGALSQFGLSGTTVQFVYDISTYRDAGSFGAIPTDGTIPQITEGRALLKNGTSTTASAQMSVTVTPNHASNILVLGFNIYTYSNGTSARQIALFQDGGADAIYTQDLNGVTGGDAPITGFFIKAAGSTSAQSYTMRAGIGSGTLVVGGSSASQLYGGTEASVLWALEIRSAG